MLSYIKGELAYAGDGKVIIDNSGIGFEIKTSELNINNVIGLTSSNVKFFTYLYVREDEMSLYGFLTSSELDTFKLLISISGVGPKAALSILSTLTLDELNMAVVSADYKPIAKANGIGKKTAERIIIDLKDKIKISDFDDSSFIDKQDSEASDKKQSSAVSEVTMALNELGYSNYEAMNAIKRVEGYQTMSTEALLKAALKTLI